MNTYSVTYSLDAKPARVYADRFTVLDSGVVLFFDSLGRRVAAAKDYMVVVMVEEGKVTKASKDELNYLT